LKLSKEDIKDLIRESLRQYSAEKYNLKEVEQKLDIPIDPRQAAQAASAAINNLPDLIALVCAPPVEINTGALGKLFGMKKVTVAPAPRDILKAEIKKVIQSNDPFSQMNSTIDKMISLFKLSGYAPANLDPAKIKKMVMNYKPRVNIPVTLPGLPPRPDLEELMHVAEKQFETLANDPLGKMMINQARSFALQNVDRFVDDSCKAAKKAAPEIKKTVKQLPKFFLPGYEGKGKTLEDL
jgi:hypothetical protein